MKSRFPQYFGATLLSVLLLSAAGCRALKNSSAFRPQNAANSATSYQLKGVVLGKSPALKEISIHQDAIPNFEPAMNAVYEVTSRDMLLRLQPGDQIAAQVVPAPGDANNHLQHLAIVSTPKANFNTSSLPAHRILLGEQVPDIPFVTQNGKTVTFSRYRGKAVLITFFDSQCTEDCPVISAHMKAVNNLLTKNPAAYAKSHLLSISIDAAHDTPPVLRKYGLKYLNGNAAGFSHWGFVHLTPTNTERMATAFGVVYVQEAHDIDHTMQTALIGKDGRLVRTWAGDHWNPSAVAKAVAAAS